MSSTLNTLIDKVNERLAEAYENQQVVNYPKLREIIMEESRVHSENFYKLIPFFMGLKGIISFCGSDTSVRCKRKRLIITKRRGGDKAVFTYYILEIETDQNSLLGETLDVVYALSMEKKRKEQKMAKKHTVEEAEEFRVLLKEYNISSKDFIAITEKYRTLSSDARHHILEEN